MKRKETDEIKIAKIEEVSLYEIYKPLVKTKTSKKALEEALEKYTLELNDRSTLFPAHDLCVNLYNASRFSSYVKCCAHRKNEFSHTNFRIQEGIIRQNVIEIEDSFSKTLGPLISPRVGYFNVSNPPGKTTYPGSSMKMIMLPYAFMMAFTSLEMYLEDRIRVEVFASQDNLIRFCKKIPYKNFPHNWKDTEEQIQYWEYSTKLPDIISEHLRFPYHTFEGAVDRVYVQAFGFHVSKFPEIRKLINARTTRNQIVHRGTVAQAIYTSRLEYRDINNFIGLCLRFAEYIENEIDRVQKS